MCRRPGYDTKRQRGKRQVPSKKLVQQEMPYIKTLNYLASVAFPLLQHQCNAVPANLIFLQQSSVVQSCDHSSQSLALRVRHEPLRPVIGYRSHVNVYETSLLQSKQRPARTTGVAMRERRSIYQVNNDTYSIIIKFSAIPFNFYFTSQQCINRSSQG